MALYHRAERHPHTSTNPRAPEMASENWNDPILSRLEDSPGDCCVTTVNTVSHFEFQTLKRIINEVLLQSTKNSNGTCLKLMYASLEIPPLSKIVAEQHVYSRILCSCLSTQSWKFTKVLKIALLPCFPC